MKKVSVIHWARISSSAMLKVIDRGVFEFIGVVGRVVIVQVVVLIPRFSLQPMLGIVGSVVSLLHPFSQACQSIP